MTIQLTSTEKFLAEVDAIANQCGPEDVVPLEVRWGKLRERSIRLVAMVELARGGLVEASRIDGTFTHWLDALDRIAAGGDGK